MNKMTGIWSVCLLATVASADITLSFLGDNVTANDNGDNIADNKFNAMAGVVIGPGGVGARDAGPSFNYPGNNTPVSGSVDASYNGSKFDLRINPYLFNNDTNSANFGDLATGGNAPTDTWVQGLGVVYNNGDGYFNNTINGSASSNRWEGVSFSLGAADMVAGSKVQLTTVTLGLFNGDESVYIRNSESGAYMQADASGGSVIDVSSLNILVDAGQAGAADFGDSLTNNTFSIITAFDAGENQGYRVESLGFNVIPEPATMGLIASFGGAVLFIRRRFMM